MVDYDQVYQRMETEILEQQLSAMHAMIHHQAVVMAELQEELGEATLRKEGVVGDTLPLHQVADLLKACAGSPPADLAMRQVAQVLGNLRPDSCYKISNIKLLRAAFSLPLKQAKHLIESPMMADLTGFQQEAE